MNQGRDRIGNGRDQPSALEGDCRQGVMLGNWLGVDAIDATDATDATMGCRAAASTKDKPKWRNLD